MNLLTIAYYELKRILRNHRLVLIVLSQPIVISIIVGLMVYHDPQNIKLGIINKNHNEFSDQLEEKIKENNKFIVEDRDEANVDDIKNGKIRGFVIINIADIKPVSGKVEVLNDPTGRHIRYVVESEISRAVAEISKEITLENVSKPNIEIASSLIEPIEYSSKELTPFKLQNFDYFASAIMVLLIILVVINLSGISITSERASGTFERLFVTPYSKIDVILGKAISLLAIGIIIALIGTGSLYFIFSISIGNFWLVMLINLLVGATAVTLGLLVSSVTYSVVESAELAMYLFFVSVITTGILSPIETANKYFAYVMKVVPFYYAVDASRRVNMVDAGWSNIAINIYILIGAFLFFLLLSIVLLRREAK